MKILCWIHFCCMQSCKWHHFPTNRKIQNGRRRTYSIPIFFCHFHIKFLCFETLIYRNRFECLALMIWNMTSNGTQYVIERSSVRAPPGISQFPPQKMWTVSRIFVYYSLGIYIYIYIYIYMHCIDDWIHGHHQWNSKWPKTWKVV